MSTASQTELFKRAFKEMMKDIGTSIPGHVLSFDSGPQLAQIQIGVKRIDTDGNLYTPAPLIECPVQFAGADYLIEHELSPGNEGIIIFSQRCIDGWVNTGGVANNPILRFHDFSDAYFIPGLRSQPNKITAFGNNGIRMRNAAGDQYVWLKNNGDVEIKAANVNIESTSLTHNGTNVGDTHTHGGVSPGGSSTTGPS